MPYQRASLIALLSAALLCPAAFSQAQPTGDALSDAQKLSLQTIENDFKAKAGPSIQKIAGLAKTYDQNVLSDSPDPALQGKVANEISGAIGQVVQARIAAIGEMVKVLTPEQKKTLMVELEKPNASFDLAELIQKTFAAPRK